MSLSAFKIGTRIWILCAVMLTGFIVATAIPINQAYKNATAAGQVEDLAKLAPTISALVHELQKERGLSAGHISSKGTRLGEALAEQRGMTDIVYATFLEEINAADHSVFTMEMEKRDSAAQEALTTLSTVRGEVSALQRSVPEMAGYYTPTITKLLSIVEAMIRIPDDAELVQKIEAYTSILQGKERAGIERAMGAAGFSTGSFSEAVFRNFVQLRAAQETFFTVTAKNHPQGTGLFKGLRESEQEARVLELRALADKSVYGGSIAGVTGTDWFAASTARIDLLKDLEDTISAELVSLSQSKAQQSWTSLTWMAGISIMFLIALMGIGYIMVRSITAPVKIITGEMRQLSEDNLETEVSGLQRKDEFGDMSQAVQVFKDNAIKRVELEGTSDQERLMKDKRQAAIENLISEFRQNVQSALQQMTHYAETMNATSNSLSDVAGVASQKTMDSSSLAEQTLGNAQTVASAAEELSSSIGEIARQIEETNDAVNITSEATAESSDKIHHLADATTKIGDIVSLIQDIAEQTNLLALNATIEAARAGEMGKGFAVVASEVKALATQTANATAEISNQITTIQGSTEMAVGSITSIGERINRVKENVNAISAATTEQAAATQEISASVQQVSMGTETVSANMGEVNQTIDQTTMSAGSVLETSSALREQAQNLEFEIEKFLKNVEAA